MNREIAKLSNHFIVCGAGEIGSHVAQELASTLRPFVLIDQDGDRLERVTCCVPNLLFINGDATEDETLLAAGIERAAGVVATLPSDKDNLYIAVMAKELNPKARVVALGIEDKAVDKLLRAGADSVVSVPRIGGLRIASEMMRPSTVKFLDTMLRQTGSTYRFEEITVPAGSHAISKKLADFPFRDKYGLLVLAIMKPHEGESAILYNPPADTTLKEKDVVVVLGDIKDIHDAAEALTR